jgi:ABC-type antimicrobial peptide transport system permease subunit
MLIAVSGSGNPADLVQPVRNAVLRVDPNLPVSEIRTMGEILEGQMAGPHFFTFVIGLFSALALGLAAAGIYGVIAYFVAQSTRELGIRVALGAARSGLIRLVLFRALRIIGFGIFIGLGGVLASTVVIRSLVFGVDPLDLPTVVFSALLLASTGGIAALIPCLRGTRLSPTETLRAE